MNLTTLKLSVFALLVVLISQSSCTIQKRVHLKGYHIAWHSKNQQAVRPKLAEMPLKAIQALPDTLVPLTIKKVLKTRPQQAVVAKHEKTSKQPVLVKTPKNKTQKTSKKIMPTEQPTPAPKQRKAALLTGFSLVLMTILAALSAPVVQGIYAAGNALTTAANLSANLSAFNAAIWGWVGIFLLDILVSVGVYNFYKKAQPILAKLTAIFRLIYTAFLGVAVAQLFLVNASGSAVQVLSKFTSFFNWWGWGLIVFGLHLITLAFLFKSTKLKPWLATLIRALLLIAGIGYLVLYVGLLIVPNPVQFQALIEPIFILPMVLGEFFYAIYMLVSGGKTKGAAH